MYAIHVSPMSVDVKPNGWARTVTDIVTLIFNVSNQTEQ